MNRLQRMLLKFIGILILGTSLVLVPGDNPSMVSATAGGISHFSAKQGGAGDGQTGMPATDNFSLQKIRELPIPSYALTKQGNYLYVASRDRGLQILDVTDMENPIKAGHFEMPNDGVWGVAVRDNYAYVAASSFGSSTGLRIVDISDPANPNEVGNYDTIGLARSVTVHGNYAYVADDWNGLEIIDISTPTAPVQIGHYFANGNTVWHVEVASSRAYLASSKGGLLVLDISSPSAPYKLGQYKGSTGNEYTNDLVVDGDYVYLAQYNIACCPAASWSGLRIVNVANAGTPTEAGSYATSQANSVMKANTHLYLTNAQDGFSIFELSNPTSPLLKSSHNTSGSVFDILASGKYLYVADSNELIIYERVQKIYLPLILP